jgi:hypothetical protein
VQVDVYQEPQRWAEEQFAGAKLSDIRRVARVKTIAAAMAVQPGRSIPQLGSSPYAVQAASHLFHHEEATPEHRQAGHRDVVRTARRQPGVSLFVDDTTELSWSGNQAIAGLGPLGKSAAGLQGFLFHTVLGVRWLAPATEHGKRQPVEVMGVGDQQYDVRQPCRKPRESSPERLRRARESQVWPPASQHLGPAPAGGRWIRGADRAADIDA